MNGRKSARHSKRKCKNPLCKNPARKLSVYCWGCNDDVMAQMKEVGYLEPFPAFVPSRLAQARENREETKDA